MIKKTKNVTKNINSKIAQPEVTHKRMQ